MAYGLLNLGSLLLGLAAWILPLANFRRSAGAEIRNWAFRSIASIMACVMSLYLQILYQNHLVKIEDWSAIIDTSNAVTLVSGVLILGTIVLNAAAAKIYFKMERA